METIATTLPIKTLNPFNNELVKSFEVMSDEQVESRIALADNAFQIWKKTPKTERAGLLHRVAHLMRIRKPQLEALATLEMGKLLKESLRLQSLQRKLKAFCFASTMQQKIPDALFQRVSGILI